MESKAFIERLAERMATDRENVGEFIFRMTEVLGEQLREGNSFSLPSFGTFEPRKKMERITIHPATGKKLLVPPKLTANFRPSGMLKQKISNGKTEQ